MNYDDMPGIIKSILIGAVVGAIVGVIAFLKSPSDVGTFSFLAYAGLGLVAGAMGGAALAARELFSNKIIYFLVMTFVALLLTIVAIVLTIVITI